MKGGNEVVEARSGMRMKNRRSKEVVAVVGWGGWLKMISGENECSSGCGDMQIRYRSRKTASGSHELQVPQDLGVGVNSRVRYFP